jgi:hypothetical protein
MVTSPYIAELKEHPFWGGMGWDIALALAATADLEKPRIGLLVNTMPLPWKKKEKEEKHYQKMSERSERSEERKKGTSEYVIRVKW